MKRFLLATAALLLVALLVFLTVDAWRSNSAFKKAQAVRIGDSKQQVRRVLGRPTEIGSSGIFDPSESWSYGGYFDWQRVTLRFRLFGPDANEVAVRFDNAGRVNRIQIPKK